MIRKVLYVVFSLLVTLCLIGSLESISSGAEEPDILRNSVIIYVTYETPNKNFLSTEHKPISSADMYELVYLGDGGTAENPKFPSVPHFYQTSTNGKVMIVPAKDSLGRGPIIEVVVPDVWARSWDLYTDNTHPTRGSTAWNNFVINEVMPRACQNFNFYEFASTTTVTGGNTYATVTVDDLTAALVISGYATATDQDYVWTTPNIDGTVGAPSIWGNGGSARNTNINLYKIPDGAKSLVSPDFNVGNMGLRLNSAYVTPSAATSPSDGHFYGPRGFGVYAHEMGHSALRFADTYDVQGYYRVQDNYPDPIPYPMRAATGNWSTMATGGYIYYKHEGIPTSEFFRKYYNTVSGAEPLNFRPGLLDAYNMVVNARAVPVDLANPSGEILPEYEGKTITMKRGDVYRLRTQDPNQYFFLQVRIDRDYDMATFQWGRKYARRTDKSVDGGLLIMRVDNGFSNGRTALSHPTVIEEAHGGIQDLRVRRIYDRSGDEDKFNFGDPGDLFGITVKDFGPYTSPSSRLFYSSGDAALDPNRQVTNLGDAPKWHMSEILYNPSAETVSFKVSSNIPKVLHTAITSAKVSSAGFAPFLGKLGIVGSVLVPPIDELHKNNVIVIDAPHSDNDPKDAESGVIVRASPRNGDAVLLGLKLKGSEKHKIMLVLSSGIHVDVEELASSAGLDFKPTVEGDNVSFSTLLIPGATPGGLASVIEVEGKPVIVIFGGEVDGEASATYFLVKKPKEELEDKFGCNAVYGLFVIFFVLPFALIRKFE